MTAIKPILRIGAWLQFLVAISLITYLSLTPSPGETFESIWDKALHFIGWATLCFSLRVAWLEWRHFVAAAIALWIYSFCIEVVQSFTGRQFSLQDFFANGVGILFAVIVVWFLLFLWQKISRKTS